MRRLQGAVTEAVIVSSNNNLSKVMAAAAVDSTTLVAVMPQRSKNSGKCRTYTSLDFWLRA